MIKMGSTKIEYESVQGPCDADFARIVVMRLAGGLSVRGRSAATKTATTAIKLSQTSI